MLFKSTTFHGRLTVSLDDDVIAGGDDFLRKPLVQLCSGLRMMISLLRLGRRFRVEDRVKLPVLIGSRWVLLIWAS